MTFVSFAQNLEDVVLWRALGGVAAGFYIDVGASFPDADSVTRAFYDRGWQGINIEPATEPFARLASQRPRDINLDVAVTDAPGHAAFYSIGNGEGLSTLDADLAARHRATGHACQCMQVATTTLRAICEQYVAGPIHFLKIDAEGAEAAILSGADFARFRPWIVVVEATFPNSQLPTWQEWEPSLLQAGYGFVYFDGLNRFYLAREQDETLRASFATPPNVFDDFVSWQVDAARAQAAQFGQAAEAAEQARAAIEREAHDRHAALAADLTLARDRLAAHEAALVATRAQAESAQVVALERGDRFAAITAQIAATHALATALAEELAAVRHDLSRAITRAEDAERLLASQIQALAAAHLERGDAETALRRVEAARAELAERLEASEANLAAASGLSMSARRSMMAEIDTLAQQSDILRARLKQAEQRQEDERAAQRRELHEREAELARLYASTSWRLSAPVRFAKRLLTWSWRHLP